MPSGPSHSHSSGGGHSGGGSSSFGGGGSFGGSYGGGYRPRGPMHMHFFGHTVILTGRKQATLGLLIFFFIFCTFIAFITGITSSSSTKDINENNAYVRQMEVDNLYYSNMIEKAKNGEDGYYLITTHFPTEINYEYYSNDDPGVYYFGDHETFELYYIVYEFENPHNNNQILSGVTYAQFTKAQIWALHGQIEIAYHEGPVGEIEPDAVGWYSMNTSYPAELSNNQEYLYTKALVADAQASYNVTHTIFIVVLVIDAIVLIAFIASVVLAIKNSKKEAELEEQKKKAEIREKQAQADATEAELQKKNRVCDYCGCSVPDGATKCPVCGASKFKKKK